MTERFKFFWELFASEWHFGCGFPFLVDVGSSYSPYANLHVLRFSYCKRKCLQFLPEAAVSLHPLCVGLYFCSTSQNQTCLHYTRWLSS